MYSQRANAATIVAIPRTQYRSRLDVLVEQGLASPVRKRILHPLYGLTVDYRVAMNDRSGWWPVTRAAFVKLGGVP